MPRWFLGHSVTINGENLICMVGGEKALVAVLNKKTGEPVKTFANPSGGPTSYVTPYFFEFEGISVLAVMTDTTACGYDYKTGKLLFSIPWVNQRTTHCTMPIYKDGHLFLSTGYSFGAKGFKLTKNADGTITPEELWYEQRFDNHHGGIILVGDYVYGVTSRGNWCAVNFLTGEVSYLARPVGEDAAISYADGMIYALSYDSRTVVLWEPNPKEFVERGRFTLPHEAEGKSWAHPVVIGGRLYLRHAEHLYCYDIKAK
jgi:outer membrane protein assembly factor BamB